MQEIYNAIAETTEHSGDGERGLAEEDAIASRAKSPSLDCTMCLEEPMLVYILIHSISASFTLLKCELGVHLKKTSNEHKIFFQFSKIFQFSKSAKQLLILIDFLISFKSQ